MACLASAACRAGGCRWRQGAARGRSMLWCARQGPHSVYSFQGPCPMCVAGLLRTPGKARDWRQQWGVRGGNAVQQQGGPAFGLLPSLNNGGGSALDAFAQPQAPPQVRQATDEPPSPAATRQMLLSSSSPQLIRVCLTKSCVLMHCLLCCTQYGELQAGQALAQRQRAVSASCSGT